jgi:hypothetical protein
LARSKVSPRHATALPYLSWEELEEELLSMAATPAKEAMVTHLVEGLRQSSPFLTEGGLLRELAIIIVALIEPGSKTLREAPVT